MRSGPAVEAKRAFRLHLLLSGFMVAVLFAAPIPAADRNPSLLVSEFIFTDAPFAQCHASTVIETANGEWLAAWFGGRHEKSADTAIWMARRDAKGWSAPQKIADGIGADGKRQPVWNPVLFQPRGGPLLLFYKVGPDPAQWRGMLTSSNDGGRNWAKPGRLPGDVLGPAKNKPIELADGTILSPSSSESDGWRLVIERSTDHGRSWQRIGPLATAGSIEAIQPTLLAWRSGRIQLLARSRQGRIVESASTDGGLNWSPLRTTSLPNPNSGIDAVMLRDGRALLVYNPSRWRRSPLRVAISGDGRIWRDALKLEDGWGEYSYPAVIQSADGLVHVTYTWKRERIRHAVIDPRQLAPR